MTGRGARWKDKCPELPSCQPRRPVRSESRDRPGIKGAPGGSSGGEGKMTLARACSVFFERDRCGAGKSVDGQKGSAGQHIRARNDLDLGWAARVI